MKKLCALVGVVSLAWIALISSDDMATCQRSHSVAVCQHTLNR